MSAARPDPLARWRAARAAQTVETVATVATTGNAVATPAEAQKSAIVATVATVATRNSSECVAPGGRDGWGLSEADRADAMARLAIAIPPAAGEAPDDPEPMDHDAGERAAMAAHYAEPAAPQAYAANSPDPLRDGLARGFHNHRAAWEALPCGAERGRAFAEVRREPGACTNCAGRRWWCEAGETDTELRCTTCHPPIHLPPDAVHEVTK